MALVSIAHTEHDLRALADFDPQAYGRFFHTRVISLLSHFHTILVKHF